MPDESQQPKIIIDSDWKAQAQREKDRLAAKEKEAAAKTPPKAAGAGPSGTSQAAPSGSPGDDQGMPPADFQSLVGTLVTQALIYMGGFPDPQTGRAMVSLEHAKFHIDMLGVLEAKTKGNLTKEEGEDLTLALSELRMRFVEIVKMIEKAGREGRLGGAGAGGGVVGAGPGVASGPGGGGMPMMGRPPGL
jgi:hypothetical protein